MTPAYMTTNTLTRGLVEYGKSNTAHVAAIPCRASRFEFRMRRNVMRLLTTAAAPAMVLCTLAFASFATPASAYEYCHYDLDHMLGCAYDNIAQCYATRFPGKEGWCLRNPFLGYTKTDALLADQRAAYAYAPNASASKPGNRRTKASVSYQ